jgi:hypothetical protein
MQLQIQSEVFIAGTEVFGGGGPPVPTDFRITEDSEFRITEDGDRRIQE